MKVTYDIRTGQPTPILMDSDVGNPAARFSFGRNHVMMCASAGGCIPARHLATRCVRKVSLHSLLMINAP